MSDRYKVGQRVDGIITDGAVKLKVLGFHNCKDYSLQRGVIVKVLETHGEHRKGDVFVTDQINLVESDPRPLVWVFTVTDELEPQPAVYVSDTEDGAWTAMSAGQGVPEDLDEDDIFDWFEKNHKVTSLDSYYVEKGL